MKKSDRVLRGTLVALAASIVAVVAANRLFFPGGVQDYIPRTTADVLATLRDFDAIRVEGDFALQVTQQPEFSVRYQAWDPVQGQFTARVEDRTLVLGGHGNRGPGGFARVEVALPALRQLSSTGAHGVEISGMRDAPLSLRVYGSPLVRLTDNHVELTMTLAGVRLLQIDATSQQQATSFEIRGQTRIETLP